MNVLIIDNYDSFVYNLYQEVGGLGANPAVFRNDAITLDEIRHIAPDAIILSPGPGH
ncbi:MAG TPA: aminodeoxychorismate/anthranilate synthase component II, partial [Thermoplasmata archaeon]|nr:aminodeoxychorismate/anthranilate synthase component II [Thermoplasmata archaeon]